MTPAPVDSPIGLSNGLSSTRGNPILARLISRASSRVTINLNGFELKVGIAHGLGNARHLLEDIRNGHNEYHVIEIMACPGGCIGGGGQPLHHGNSEILYARANALYREDANKPLRKSHENPYIKTLYEEYLGKPLGEISETLLHTHYFNKSMD